MTITDTSTTARVQENIVRNIALVEDAEITCGECGRRLDWSVFDRVEHVGSTCPGGPETTDIELAVVTAVRNDDTRAAWEHARVLAVLENGARADMDIIEGAARNHVEWASTQEARDWADALWAKVFGRPA